MRKIKKIGIGFIVYIPILLLNFITVVSANNLKISNVFLGPRDPVKNTCIIQFDITWDNSWRNKINHDAVWLTVRLQDSQIAPPHKKLCSLISDGLNPQDTKVGSNKDLEVLVPEDRKGAFLQSLKFNSLKTVSSQGVQLTVDYSSCGFDDDDLIHANVFGLEMVYIPEGPFYAGDHSTSTASLHQGSNDPDPWYVIGEDAITVTELTENGFRYASNNNPGEDTTGASFIIPEAFPKGYRSFYVLKYEITEGQWVEFVNSLAPNNTRGARDLTNSAHKNTDSVLFRQTISCSGFPLTCATQRPHRPVTYLNWMDIAAFLDWAALRPMTELEFEKISRGPLLAVAGEFAWGTPHFTIATTLSPDEENGIEVVGNPGANVHANNTTLTGGDTSLGPEHAQGALRTGIFASFTSNREQSGGGYYGVMELSGNVSEKVVTLGNITGRSFVGNHGDGYLTTTPGFEGNANVLGWVGVDAQIDRGITHNAGSGDRGGCWRDGEALTKLRISDRSQAANPDGVILPCSGGRGVRTYDGP